jgi:hypothetical protein
MHNNNFSYNRIADLLEILYKLNLADHLEKRMRYVMASAIVNRK